MGCTSWSAVCFQRRVQECQSYQGQGKLFICCMIPINKAAGRMVYLMMHYHRQQRACTSSLIQEASLWNPCGASPCALSSNLCSHILMLMLTVVLQHAWTHKNQLFVGVYEALRACEYPWYVASSKAAHRISALMGSLLGIDLPPDSPRIFADLVPPEERKLEALR